MRPGPRYETSEVHKGAFSQDGARLAVVLTHPPWLQIVSADAHAELPLLEGMPGFSLPAEAMASMIAFAFSPDGTTFALQSWPVGVFVWDTSSGRLVRERLRQLRQAGVLAAQGPARDGEHG